MKDTGKVKHADAGPGAQVSKATDSVSGHIGRFLEVGEHSSHQSALANATTAGDADDGLLAGQNQAAEPGTELDAIPEHVNSGRHPLAHHSRRWNHRPGAHYGESRPYLRKNVGGHKVGRLGRGIRVSRYDHPDDAPEHLVPDRCAAEAAPDGLPRDFGPDDLDPVVAAAALNDALGVHFAGVLQREPPCHEPVPGHQVSGD
jgi:hypothetical protein